jgi:hypothetical protein
MPGKNSDDTCMCHTLDSHTPTVTHSQTSSLQPTLAHPHTSCRFAGHGVLPGLPCLAQACPSLCTSASCQSSGYTPMRLLLLSVLCYSVSCCCYFFLYDCYIFFLYHCYYHHFCCCYSRVTRCLRSCFVFPTHLFSSWPSRHVPRLSLHDFRTVYSSGVGDNHPAHPGAADSARLPDGCVRSRRRLIPSCPCACPAVAAAH